MIQAALQRAGIDFERPVDHPLDPEFLIPGAGYGVLINDGYAAYERYAAQVNVVGGASFRSWGGHP